MVISVLVEINIDKIFDYNVPKELEPLICLGKRVLVPFGKSKTDSKFIISAAISSLVLNCLFSKFK